MKLSESLSTFSPPALPTLTAVPVDAIVPAVAWDRVKRRLRAEYGEDVFSSWFARLDLDAVVDDTAQMSVPTRFLRSWIQTHYLDKILALLASELPGIVHISLNVRTAARPAAAPVRPLSAAPEPVVETSSARTVPFLRSVETTVREDELAGSPLDRRMSFESYFVGRSNALAHAAALQVARAGAGEPVPYNPLFIHAAVGLGKSHLIQATAHLAESRGRREPLTHWDCRLR